MRRLLIPLLVASAIAAAACGRGDDPRIDVPSGGAPTTTAGEGSTSTAPLRADEQEGSPGAEAFAMTRTSTPPNERGLLTAVRHARHDGFHRVVFEFDEGLPGYRVEFTEKPLREDGSGDEVDVGGDHPLLLHFEPASAVDLQGERAVETYTGPERLEVEEGPVVEIVEVSDFEANLEWAVGLAERRPFRVFTLVEPPRVVIDIQV